MPKLPAGLLPRVLFAWAGVEPSATHVRDLVRELVAAIDDTHEPLEPDEIAALAEISRLTAEVVQDALGVDRA